VAYQRKDAFHQRAKAEGYASRAAYKLEEIQHRTRVLRKGQRVVDLGCWPGGWLQVAAGLVGPKGRVVGIDIASIDPPLELANVVALSGDLSNPPAEKEILEALGGRAHVVLSDAAPKLTGIRATDRAREEVLLEAIEALVPRLLAPGGSAVIKLLDCPEADAFRKRLARSFAKSRVLKPKATRQGSTERYLLLESFTA